MGPCTPHPEGLLLDLHVQPNAPKSDFAGRHGERLKVKIGAPAVDGKANQELCRFLAAALDLRRADVSLLSGDKGRDKRVLLHVQSDRARAIARQLAGAPS